MNTYVHGGCDCLDNVPSNVPESRLPAPFIPTRRPPRVRRNWFRREGDCWSGGSWCFLGPFHPPFPSLYTILIKYNKILNAIHPSSFSIF